MMGPNGCGKSTVIRALCQLDGLDAGGIRESQSADLAATVLQHFRSQLMPQLNVTRNILLPFGGIHEPMMSPDSALRYVRRVLAILGFTFPFTKDVGTLSGGEQQALVFVRSLLFKPSLWLLDEPVSAIDFARRRRFLFAIWRRAFRCSTLMVTHDVNDAILVASRLLVFDSSMTSLLDEKLPPPDQKDILSRLQSSWAADLRQRLLSIAYLGADA
jgi:sulfonate transport system ATP-binding protein